MRLGASEWAKNKRTGAYKQSRASYKWELQANDLADKQMDQYSTRQFHDHSTHCQMAKISVMETPSGDSPVFANLT